MTPIQEAKNVVYRMKLEARNGILSPERHTRHLAKLGDLLDVLEPTPDVEGLQLTPAGLAVVHRISPSALRTEGVSYGRLFVIDGGRP